jgi:hypothetical protein
MKISYILGCLNQIKIHHWFTNSYAEHKALQKAYNNLDDIFDKLVEVYLGKNGKDENIVSNYDISITGWSATEPLDKYYENMRNSLITYIRGILNPEGDKDLLNLVDELEGQFNQLIYLLRLK